MQYRVAFLGLGVMGFPMAGHMARQGYNTRVWNRTAAKAANWQDQYGTKDNKAHDSIAEAVKDADIVCLCLGNDDDVRSVVLGEDGVLAHIQSGSLLVDHTTTSVRLAKELAQLAGEKDVAFVDAPVSGGQSGAEQGKLTIMLGGTEADVARAEPVLTAYAKTITHMGDVGNGQLAKMVNQICIAGVLQGLSEGLVFAQKNGLDGEKLLDAIGQGAAQSWQMNNRGSSMLKDQFDFGFAVNWMIKDLGYCLEQAKDSGLRLPVTEQVLAQYRELAAQEGGGRLDTSSLIRSVAAASTS